MLKGELVAALKREAEDYKKGLNNKEGLEYNILALLNRYLEAQGRRLIKIIE